MVHLKEATRTSSVSAIAINHLDTIGEVGLNNHNEILVCTGYLHKNDIVKYASENAEMVGLGTNNEVLACVGYMNKSNILKYVPTDIENVIPLYKHFEGWSIQGHPKTYAELPEACRKYLEFIEEYLQVPIEYIGIGPGEKDYVTHIR